MYDKSEKIAGIKNQRGGKVFRSKLWQFVMGKGAFETGSTSRVYSEDNFRIKIERFPVLGVHSHNARYQILDCFPS